MKTDNSNERARASRLFTFATVLGTVGLGVLTAGCSAPETRSAENVRSQSAAQVREGGAPTPVLIGDFDGDHRADPAMWRPSTGEWLVRNSRDGSNALPVVSGSAGDWPVLGDFDGDGKMDYAAYDSFSGTWQIVSSFSGVRTFTGWGIPGDVPAPGDYDGDGKTDIAVYRPKEQRWLVANASASAAKIDVTFGDWNIYLVAGDYDGDQRTDFAYYSLADQTWHIRFSAPKPNGAIGWGNSGDVPVPGDYDGDGMTDAAMYRPDLHQWLVRRSSNPNADTLLIEWGETPDVLIPGGDFDGDGVTDCAMYRPKDKLWLPLASNPFVPPDPHHVEWGMPGDVPLLHTQIRFVPRPPS